MRKLTAVLCGAAALIALSGCVAHVGYGGGYYGDYDGYYDGYYGPYGGGYWASDGFFYYSDEHHNYHRDDSKHFRHERFENAKPVKAEHRDRDGKGDHGDKHDNGNNDQGHH
jgi:hypothetical protein